MTLTDPFALLQSCAIAHHIPGRLRVKLTCDGSALPPNVDAQALLERLRATPGIRKVSVNLMARSCTVHYDAGEIAPEAWGDLIAGWMSDAALALKARFDAKCCA